MLTTTQAGPANHLNLMMTSHLPGGFLQTGGSYKTAAEQLMLHKNTVQYRVRKAEESLGRPAGENRHDVELALRASHWLGSSVLQPARERSAAPTGAA